MTTIIEEWDTEPDKRFWVDEVTGLACGIIRHPTMKHLCGYVHIPGTLSEREAQELNVHWGITFHYDQDKVGDDFPQSNVGGQWLGFDCAHHQDLVPGLEQYGMSGKYRNWAFVEKEIRGLALQLKRLLLNQRILPEQCQPPSPSDPASNTENGQLEEQLERKEAEPATLLNVSVDTKQLC